MIAVRTVAFVRLCCCAVRASKQRAAGTKGVTHRRATRGWRFEAVARGLWAVRTSLLPRPRCVTSARHPFGASACGVRLRGRVSSRSVDRAARSSWPFVPSTAPAPPRTRAETFLNDTRCVGTHPVHLRVYAPTCVYRDQYLKTRAPAAYTHPKSSRTRSNQQPRMYTHPPVRIRTRVCVDPHGAYTHPPPHLYAYAQTRRAVRIHAPAYAPDAAYTPESDERHVTTCARDRGRRK